VVEMPGPGRREGGTSYQSVVVEEALRDLGTRQGGED